MQHSTVLILVKTIIATTVFFLGLYVYLKFPTKESFIDNSNTTTQCQDLLLQEGSNFYLFNSNLATETGKNPIKFSSLGEYTDFVELQRSQGIHCPILYLQQAFDTQGETVFKVRPSPTNLQGGLPDLTLLDTESSAGVPAYKGTKDVPTHSADVKMPTSSKSEERLRMGTDAPAVLPDIKTHSPKTLLIDSNRDDQPYNANSYPGFDAHNQDIGLDTPLDKMFTEGSIGKPSPNPMDTNWGGAEMTEKLISSGYYRDNEVSRLRDFRRTP